jgi:tetratricopeptide (TPR) repeat protein
LVVAILSGIALASARAEDGATQDAQAEKIDPDARRLVQLLLGEDEKGSDQAAQALERRGVAGARAVIEQRARTRSARERERLERVYRDVVNALIVDLQRPFVAPAPRYLAQAALGDGMGSIDPGGEATVTTADVSEPEVDAAGAAGREEPKSPVETQKRARAAACGLVSLGAPAIGLGFDVPPVRPPAALWALSVLSREVYQRDSARVAASAGERDALRAHLKGRADLALPFVEAGMTDSREDVRTFYQAVRDDALELALSGLESADPDRRETSQGELYRLGELARATLVRIARGEHPRLRSAEARLAAARIAHRIEYRLSPVLIRKLGSELEGYEELPFDKRRSVAFELERLGGQDAVPALRQLLREEKTLEVQAVAAIGLVKQGDPLGAQWLNEHNQHINLIAKRDLAALILEEGNNYLKFKKYEQAEKHYLQVLEIEPKNEYALYNLACCYSLWGRTDAALQYLVKSIEAGFDDLSHMDADTDLDPIREDARFKDIMDRLRAKKQEKTKKAAGADDGDSGEK